MTACTEIFFVKHKDVNTTISYVGANPSKCAGLFFLGEEDTIINYHGEEFKREHGAIIFTDPTNWYELVSETRNIDKLIRTITHETIHHTLHHLNPDYNRTKGVEHVIEALVK